MFVNSNYRHPHVYGFGVASRHSVIYGANVCVVYVRTMLTVWNVLRNVVPDSLERVIF